MKITSVEVFFNGRFHFRSLWRWKNAMRRLFGLIDAKHAAIIDFAAALEHNPPASRFTGALNRL